MKVYCKKCKFCFYSNEYSYAGDYCCKLSKTILHNSLSKSCSYARCQDINPDNECVNWEPTFFVKLFGFKRTKSTTEKDMDAKMKCILEEAKFDPLKKQEEK